MYSYVVKDMICGGEIHCATPSLATALETAILKTVTEDNARNNSYERPLSIACGVIGAAPTTLPIGYTPEELSKASASMMSDFSDTSNSALVFFGESSAKIQRTAAVVALDDLNTARAKALASAFFNGDNSKEDMVKRCLVAHVPHDVIVKELKSQLEAIHAEYMAVRATMEEAAAAVVRDE